MLQLTDQRPRVYVKTESGQEIEIGYACKFNYDEGSVELPDNLPGGSEVWIGYGSDAKHLTTTAILLEEGRKPRALRRNLLAAAIGAMLYRGRPGMVSNL